MSQRNTPNLKNTKLISSKFATPSTSSTTPVKPARTTLSTTKKLSAPSPLPRPGIIKQSSACDLRERLHLNSDDILNTGFAATPPISRLNRPQSKSKLTAASSSQAINSALNGATNGLSSTKSTAKRLFGNSTPNLYEAVNRTPECFTKVAADTPTATPRTIKASGTTPYRSHKSEEYATDNKAKDSSEESCLTVAVRVRPMNAKECTTPSVINVVSVDGNEVSVFAGTTADSSAANMHNFRYDYAFSSYDTDHENYADQKTVFNGTTMPLIDKAFEGYNACLFAYGQTGSGKSYSMMGIDSDDDNALPNPEAGIIPRFCHELFRRIDLLSGKYSAEIEVSYFEIYNEKIHDLLAVTPTHVATPQYSTPSSQIKRPALRIREHPRWGPYVEDLNTHAVDSIAALKNWLAVGNSQRATAATGMNDKSSRSHSIFTIILTLSEIGNDSGKALTKRSRINLVDLAGSERVSQTCASGERLKEGISINQSLLTLGKVIAALAENRKTFGAAMTDAKKCTGSFIPYRDSVLTRLLKESLGGNSKTVMLATISPASLHTDETLATLRYACQARSIVNRVKVNEDPNDREIHKLRAEVDCLRAQVQYYKRQEIHAVEAAPRKIIIETIDGSANDEEEKEKLRQQLREKEQDLARAEKSWRERLREADSKIKNEMRLLQQNGLALQLSVAQKQPCLINLATDPMLSGTLLYILPPGIVRIGRPKPSTHLQSDIVLDGPLVGQNHCQIDNRRGKLYIRPEEDCETFVNGELITEERQIYHGDRIVIGGSHYFRISNPDCSRRSQSTVADYETAHQEILREQEKRLRLELMAEKQAALQEIEEERAKNELSYNEKVARLELEQFRYKCSQELVDMEKAVLAQNRLNESVFEYKPYESNLMEKIRRIMEHPTDEGLHETQLKVKEATQRCRDLGLNYEFIQTQVADEFGLFKAVVNIIDRDNNRNAEWPTARLNVWLDLIRNNSEITAENIFCTVEVKWKEKSEDLDLNESLNSSRISLNLSAIKETLLGKPAKSCFKAIRSKFSPWSERKQAIHNNNRKEPLLLNDNEQSAPQMKKKLTYDEYDLDDSMKAKTNLSNFNDAVLTSTPADETFESQAQHQLRDIRKATLRIKKLCHSNANENMVESKQKTAEKVLNAVEDIERLTNEIRRLLKDVDGEPVVTKTPKSVRFILD